MRGDGRIYRTGGMVVKNVAGYDVGKILLGSQGRLGPVLEVNLKLRALPEARSLRCARLPEASRAWKLAGAIRERRLDPAALLVLCPSAGASLEMNISEGHPVDDPPSGEARGGQPGTTWTVLWLFEGNRGVVSWLDSQVDEILSANEVERVDTLDDGQCRRALDFLSSLRKTCGPGDTDLVLEVTTLPGDGRGAQESIENSLQEAIRSGDLQEFLSVSDAASGIHLVSVIPGPATGGQGLKLITGVDEISRRHGGSLRVLSGPWTLWEQGQLLTPETNPGIRERIRRVFDPRGIFAPRTALGGKP
jgi:FAD/FMN-containing dehydrogenase